METARASGDLHVPATRDNRPMATSSLPDADLDPRPQPPEAPLPSDCCDSGCPICVFDSYSDELQAYREALAAWRRRHPDDVEQPGVHANEKRAEARFSRG